ncbi:MAG: flagellar basal body rod protein FlgB [Fibrobacterales bacterium]
MDLRGYMFQGTRRTLLYKSLDANGMRNRAISHNIANATTVGYQRKEVHFEEQVRAALRLKVDGETTDENHFEIGKDAAVQKVKAFARESNDATLPGEINNVDIDLEMSKLAENQIQYNYNIKFSGFEKFLGAIKGRM